MICPRMVLQTFVSFTNRYVLITSIEKWTQKSNREKGEADSCAVEYYRSLHYFWNVSGLSLRYCCCSPLAVLKHFAIFHVLCACPMAAVLLFCWPHMLKRPGFSPLLPHRSSRSIWSTLHFCFKGLRCSQVELIICGLFGGLFGLKWLNTFLVWKL